MKRIIVGIDEVGRGSWVGPLFFGAVCFLQKPILADGVYIRDSKKLTRASRERSASFLRENSIYCICRVSQETIDKKGLSNAMNEGVRRIVVSIRRKLVHVYKCTTGELDTRLHFLIDGRKICDIPHSYCYIVRGDDKVMEISAASIVAKVARDRHLARLAKIYPGYGFERNAGYGTKEHQQGLREYGISQIHRRSYAPIREMLYTEARLKSVI